MQCRFLQNHLTACEQVSSLELIATRERWTEQEDMNVYSTNELGLETEYALPGCA
jgi:hypothetical protein